ncbi:Alpha/beta-Hydrolases superfamily protein isoform 1 [Theobroma cacao]|uniref:Alpha/beta-Hydrolases superfamily protein isoform 1 n=1 Tax=Theobroma cacao TaxID=3641 RepID=A0A061G5Z0_THECC|nr:Alpha/beta-Hydrolases superfamily protein isoform 1 [Theobroma cacao]
MASSRPSKRRRQDQTEDHHTDDTESPPESKLTLEKSSPVVVFAHGAGAPSSSDWMIRWTKMLKKALNAVEVVTFDYPYISGGKRRAPPKAEKLVDFHSDIVKNAVSKYPGHPLILAGKSMGSRVSCMVAGREDIAASLIVCLGYPLKGMNGAVRDETLLQLTVPVMFVQGSKDGLCPLEKMEAVRKKMKAMSELHVIDGGDHSFKISKKHLQTKGSTQDEAEDAAVQATASFVSRSLTGRSFPLVAVAAAVLALLVLTLLLLGLLLMLRLFFLLFFLLLLFLYFLFLLSMASHGHGLSCMLLNVDAVGLGLGHGLRFTDTLSLSFDHLLVNFGLASAQVFMAHFVEGFLNGALALFCGHIN